MLEVTSVDGATTTNESIRGTWDATTDMILFVRAQRRFDVVGSLSLPLEDTSVIVSKQIKMSLSPDGRELLLEHEDGDCPGSDCSRRYRRQP